MTPDRENYLRLSVIAVERAWSAKIAHAVGRSTVKQFESILRTYEIERSRVCFVGLTRDEIVKFSQETDSPEFLQTLVMLALSCDSVETYEH